MNTNLKVKVLLACLSCVLLSPGCDSSVMVGTPLPSQTPARVSIDLPTTTPTERVIQGTVQIWHSWEEMQRSALFRRIASFQARYPDVQFDVSYIPAIDLRQSFESASADGAGPTILIGPSSWGAELANQDIIASITRLASPETLAGINPAAVEETTYQASLIGIPLHLNGVVLYRNKSLIANSPTSFDSLVNVAATVNQAGKTGAVLERSFYYSAAHLHGLGGALMAPNGDPAFDLADYQASLEWLELLKAFDRAGATVYQSDNDLKYFIEGRAGFIIESTNQMYFLAGEVSPLNLAIDSWPVYHNGRLSGFVEAEIAYLTPKALQETSLVSWLFIESLLSPESQATLAGVGYIPAIKLESFAGSNERLSDPFITQAMTALAGGTAYPARPETSIYAAEFDKLLQQVLFQGVEPFNALQSAFDSIQDQVDVYRDSNQGTP